MIAETLPLADRRATRLLGRALGRAVAPGELVVLTGPLGAGKTFLVRAVCRALGLDGAVPVTSPTFTLVHEHPTTPPLIHADLYRLHTEADVAELGLVERRDAGFVLFVEWGEPFIGVLGGDAVVVELGVSPRCARIRATGPRSQTTIARL